VGFFMPETLVFIGDSVLMVAKRRETVYLDRIPLLPVRHQVG